MITEYGKRLRELREREGESQGQMAYKLGVSNSLLSSVEHGNANIPRYLTRRVLKEYKTLNKEQRQAILRAEIDQKRIPIKSPYQKLRIKIQKLMNKYIEQVRLWQGDNPFDKGSLYQLNETIEDLEELLK